MCTRWRNPTNDGSKRADARGTHETSGGPRAFRSAWCRSCVTGKGKIDGHFLKAPDDSGEIGAACDHCFMGEAVEGDAMNERCLPVLVHKSFGDR